MSYIKFAKNIGTVGFINVLVVLKSIILLSILTKLLSIAHYGVFSQIMVSLGLSTPLITLGLPYALIRFLAVSKDKKEIQEGIYSVAALTLFIALLCGFILIAFSSFFSNFLKIPGPLLIVLAAIIVFEALNFVFLNSLIAFQKIKAYSLFMILHIVGEISFTIFALWQGWGIYGAVAAFLVIRMLIFLSLFTFVIAQYGLNFPRFTHLKQYLYFGLPAMASNISYWVLALAIAI